MNLTQQNNYCLLYTSHGFKAKDKSFNADFDLIADENLPKVNIIPQDMGRVILNLINNAFWADVYKRQGGDERGRRHACRTGRVNI